MSPRTMARLLLTLAGIYDGVLGLLFLVAAPWAFSVCNIPVPTHWGYVHFGAALLLIFSLMFFSAAVYPAGNRNLIAFGMLLKVAYCGTVGYHWANGGVPLVFTLFLLVDAVWVVVLGWIFWAMRPVKEIPAETPSAATAGTV